MSRTFPGFFPEHLLTFLGNSNCPEFSRSIPRKFPGNFQDISRTCSGIFRDISRTSPGSFQDISRTFPEHSLPDISRKVAGDIGFPRCPCFFCSFFFACALDFAREGLPRITLKYLQFLYLLAKYPS